MYWLKMSRNFGIYILSIYPLLIYRHLYNNIISVIKDNAFNNLPSLYERTAI